MRQLSQDIQTRPVEKLSPNLFDDIILQRGTSLVVQWLRLHAPKAEGLGSIPGQGTRFNMPQLRVHMLHLKVPHAATKKSHVPQLRPSMAK